MYKREKCMRESTGRYLCVHKLYHNSNTFPAWHHQLGLSAWALGEEVAENFVQIKNTKCVQKLGVAGCNFWLTQGLPSETALLLSITDACKGVPASPHLVKARKLWKTDWHGKAVKNTPIHMGLTEQLQPFIILHSNSKPRTNVCCFSWKWKGGKRPWDRRGRREHELQRALPTSSILSFRTRDKAWAMAPTSEQEPQEDTCYLLPHGSPNPQATPGTVIPTHMSLQPQPDLAYT